MNIGEIKLADIYFLQNFKKVLIIMLTNKNCGDRMSVVDRGAKDMST